MYEYILNIEHIEYTTLIKVNNVKIPVLELSGGGGGGGL